MTKFSERMKIVSPKDTIQITSIDEDLRTALWNVLYGFFLVRHQPNDYIVYDTGFGLIFGKLWVNFLNKQLDKKPQMWFEAQEFLNYMFFHDEWYTIYDVIEYIISINDDITGTNEEFIPIINQALEKYFSGYRIIGKIVAPITTESEIEAIEAAINNTDKLRNINLHIQEALKKLSDRTKPDFRNSIKESISAVEALCRIISGNPKATLGDALKAIEKNGGVKIHGALISGFSSIYGWTNDAQGIRHSLMDVPNLKYDDAIFMLVSCSAFINYLIAKSMEALIKLT
jgi:uncharacterized protein with PIN domain